MDLDKKILKKFKEIKDLKLSLKTTQKKILIGFSLRRDFLMANYLISYDIINKYYNLLVETTDLEDKFLDFLPCRVKEPDLIIEIVKSLQKITKC